MSERRRDPCWCPLLAATTEMEQLIFTAGVRRSGYSGQQALALLIGQLRGKYGCPGSSLWGCYWHGMTGHAIDLMEDEGVPEIRPRKNQAPGTYL